MIPHDGNWTSMDGNTTLGSSMTDLGALLDRLASAITHTSWRCEMGAVDPALVARAEARLGPIPMELRAFLSRVVLLENHAGDVRFLSARELADERSEASTLLADWRHADESAASGDRETAATTRAFWDGVVPFVMSTVNGDDFLAVDRQHNDQVIEAWGEQGWSESARTCATSFATFLEMFTNLVAAGPSAFECGWRLSRRTIQQFHQHDARYREPLVPLLFVNDFDAASPRRRPSRPMPALRGRR